MSPDPIEDLASVDQPLGTVATDQLLDMARTLPARIKNQTIRADVKAMHVFDMSPIADVTDFSHQRTLLPNLCDARQFLRVV